MAYVKWLMISKPEASWLVALAAHPGPFEVRFETFDVPRPGPGQVLIDLTDLPVDDSNCPTGGVQIDVGLDNGSGGGIAAFVVATCVGTAVESLVLLAAMVYTLIPFATATCASRP